MATEQPRPPIRDHAEWALMWTLLGVALATIVMAAFVTASMYLGVI